MVTNVPNSVDGRRARRDRTRTRVAAAAAALFVEQGYAATTIASIAVAAGVAQPTVYSTFGTKAAILATALDLAIAGDDEPVAVNDRPWMQPVWHSPTAEERLRAYASAVCRIQTGAGGILAVVAAAAGVDEEAAALAAEAERRRRLGATAVVDAVREVSRLRPGLTRTQAIDVLSLLTGPAPYQHLVVGRGWSLRRYGRWQGDTMCTQLLPDA